MTRALVSDGTITLDDETLSFTLLRVPRRKHVHLVINDDARLEVRAPWRYSLEKACGVVREHQDWVMRKVRAARERTAERPDLVHGAELPFLDERLQLRIDFQPQMKLFHALPDDPQPAAPFARVRRDGDKLHVHATSLRRDEVRGLLERWYVRQAKSVLPKRLFELADRMQLYPQRVTVRAQRTRWGSCSSRGAINVNWRLVLLPLALADYVLIHELCHLRHLDHSAAFWDMVGQEIPDYAYRREQLRAMQSMLPL